ncbi:hypothetical protein [Rubritepida flocculans]|uniref:hypothetical protein n=1 Tax=Rubritepida flocculans TaxID=182403 RepID=UPI0004029F4A|nr:hypothetical protein [Rubritepida flocculans]
MKPLHQRADGSVVVELENGLPYHVLPDDPLWAQAQELDWSLAVPEEVPPPHVVHVPAPRVLTEDSVRAMLAALGFEESRVEAAISAFRQTPEG